MRLVRAPRIPSLPTGAVVALAAVAGVVVLNELIGWWRGTGGAVLCAFRVATGAPCPGCGGTRAILAMLRGDFAGAVRLNPLVFVVAAAAAVVLVLRLALGLKPVAHLSRRGRWAAVVTILIAVLANWVYLLSARP
jgi:hypothetical protein